ncbi:MAG TPA: SPFH domain-containing protein [Planctomycetota bacterium]|nr:SPFH domain-containing protein [Planctomycetota bacterium]
MEPAIVIAIATIVVVFVVTPLIVGLFLTDVEAGEIKLVSWLNGHLRIYRGPCKALVVPFLTVSKTIPAQAINVDIEINDQTADQDETGRPAPVKVTVKASAIVSVGEQDAMVNTAANKFFCKSEDEQLATLTDVLSSAGRRATNLLRHDQLFNARTGTNNGPCEDDELAVIIREACSRELRDLGLTFNSLNIKAVLSEVAEARRREAAARAKASADVVQAQQEQRARIAQLAAAQAIDDQERALKLQAASNGSAVAHAEAERQAAVREQRRAELAATQIAQANADAEEKVIALEAEGRAEAAKIRAVAEAEAEAIRAKAVALETSGAFMDLRRLELAPDVARQVSRALANGQFVTLAGGSGDGAVKGATDDVLKVVQTLLAARVLEPVVKGRAS